MEGVTLRSAEDEDGEFLYALHEHTMRAYVEAMFGEWDEAFQRQVHDAWFDPARVQIVEANGEPVGVLDVEARDGCLYVSRIEIRPQGCGVGSTLLNELIALGPVELHVFDVNHRARELYERLGFDAADHADGRVLMKHPGEAAPVE
jgi:ribosomal protein S18 acetylase RimI-like enzyme